MNLETAFYTLGVVFFTVFLIITIAIGGFTLSLYLRYKKMINNTRRKVEQIKQAMPIVSYFFDKLNQKRRGKRD